MKLLALLLLKMAQALLLALVLMCGYLNCSLSVLIGGERLLVAVVVLERAVA